MYKRAKCGPQRGPWLWLDCPLPSGSLSLTCNVSNARYVAGGTRQFLLRFVPRSTTVGELKAAFVFGADGFENLSHEPVIWVKGQFRLTADPAVGSGLYEMITGCDSNVIFFVLTISQLFQRKWHKSNTPVVVEGALRPPMLPHNLEPVMLHYIVNATGESLAGERVTILSQLVNGTVQWNTQPTAANAFGCRATHTEHICAQMWGW